MHANGDEATAANAYRQAMEAFNKEDYAHALSLLDHAPKPDKSGEQADVLNLRGAIYLHLHKYEDARAAFGKAKIQDPDLWAARYNEAEVSFREGKYGDSARQFDALLGKTGRIFHSDERGFLQYKVMLAQLLAGKGKAAEDYVSAHRGDHLPPLTYYYLNAAIEQKRGRGQQAGQWLAQADAQYSPASEQVMAESFKSLGWFSDRSQKVIAAARRHDTSSSTPAAMAMVELIPGGPSPTPANAVAKTIPAPPIGREVTAAVAPATPPAPADRLESRAISPAPAATDGDLEAAQMPPPENSHGADFAAPPDGVPDEMSSLDSVQKPAHERDAASAADPRAVFASPVVLGKATKGHSKPSPSPSPSDSPDDSSSSPAASPADASAGASPSASPSASSTLPTPTPAPAFMEKYEQALVKIAEKNYPAAQELLNQAEAIQPNQAEAAKLRTQIFKHYYEAAYIDYKKADYPATIERLDDADAAQPNQPDALNLRGLTLSKEKDYEHAESAFKRAIQADSTFWAARFNYAELPFNYRNYTAARTRFEELYAQTDTSKQPREAELTQFKVFLTLLLEGKVDGARSFMQHFSFSGSTPARYFCQSALDFYAGNMDQAQSEIDDAAKDFPPQLMAIFKESFFRIGWLNDNSAVAPGGSVAPGGPGAPAAPALAAASPGVSPAESPALAALSAVPGGSAITVGSPAASPVTVAPVVVAAVSVAPSPRMLAQAATPKPAGGGLGAAPAGTPGSAAAGSPGGMPLAAVTPAPAASPITGATAASPPTKAPILAVVAASPVKPVAVALGSPVASTPGATAAASALAVAMASTPVTAPTPLAAEITPGPGNALKNASGEASATPEGAVMSSGESLLRRIFVAVVGITAAWSIFTVLMTLANRKPRRSVPIKRQPIYSAKQDKLEHDPVESQR